MSQSVASLSSSSNAHHQQSQTPVDDNKAVFRQLAELQALLGMSDSTFEKVHLLDLKTRYSTLFQTLFDRATELEEKQLKEAEEEREKLARETSQAKCRAKLLEVEVLKAEASRDEALAPVQRLEGEIANLEKTIFTVNSSTRKVRLKRKAIKENTKTVEAQSDTHLEKAKKARTSKEALEEDVLALSQKKATLAKGSTCFKNVLKQIDDLTS